MKKTRSFVIVLVIVMILNLLPQSIVRFGGTVEVAANAPLTLAQLREKFPDGKYWNHAGNPGTENYKNNQDGYTSIPCNHNNTTDTCNAFMPNSTQLSWQCMGYAEKLGYDSTGYNPRDNANGWNTYYNASALDNLKAGDIVQYWNSEWNCYHSIFVIKVNGETVTYTDCNWGGTCQIRWDVTTSKSWLRERFVGGSHVRSSPGINMDNGKMTIPTIKTDSQVYKTDSTVHISWEKTSRDTDFYQYWLIVKNESTKKEVYGGDAGSTGNVDKNYYDIKLTDEGEYKITVYSVPHNDKETRQAVATSTIKVGDLGQMTTPTIRLDQKVYQPNDTIHITWDKTSANTDFYQYWLIIRNSETKEEIYGGDAGSTGNVDKNYYDIKLTGEGEYKITVYSVPHNDKETRQAVATSTIKVGDVGQMTTPTIRLDQKVYQLNNTIHITWDKTSENTDFYQYWLIIRNSETKEELYGGDAGSTGDVDKNYYDLTINKAGMYEITLYSVPYNDKETRQKSATALFAVGKCSHKYISEVTTLATCAKTGIRTYTCSVCGDSYTETIAKIATHSYGSWTTTKTATCTEEGTETRTCSICGSTETRMIAKKTHVYTTKVIQSTYDAEGYTLHICSVCGDSYKDNYTAKLALMGDVTGDGKVNTRDLNRLYAHVNGTNPLTGYEFDCGDVTGDSKINTRDLNRLYAHISETNLLW